MKRKLSFSIRLLFVGSVLVAGVAGGGILFSSILADDSQQHSVPSIEYSVNKKGQTYGSATYANTYEEEPDLILAHGIDNILGYAKKEDLRGPVPKNPEEAVALTKAAKPREIPLYDKDGEEIISTFIVGGG